MTLMPTGKEAQFIRNLHDERILRMGVPCVLTNVATYTDHPVYSDPVRTWAPPVQTQIIIDWSPKQTFLKNMGWYTEGDLPIVAQVKYADNVRIGSFIELTFQMPSEDLAREFEVVDMKVFGVGMAMTLWVNLAPKRTTAGEA